MREEGGRDALPGRDEDKREPFAERIHFDGSFRWRDRVSLIAETFTNLRDYGA